MTPNETSTNWCRTSFNSTNWCRTSFNKIFSQLPKLYTRQVLKPPFSVFRWFKRRIGHAATIIMHASESQPCNLKSLIFPEMHKYVINIRRKAFDSFPSKPSFFYLRAWPWQGQILFIFYWNILLSISSSHYTLYLLAAFMYYLVYIYTGNSSGARVKVSTFLHA